jgi:hypothetical protein
MIRGGYSARPGGGGQFLPRVVQLSIDRVGPARPATGRPLELVVSLHEEATPLTWRRPIEVSRDDERRLIARTAELHGWSVGLMHTSAQARRLAIDLGRDLHRTFLGRTGAAVLAELAPTAVVLAVDESVLNLPWELLRSAESELALDVPFGRAVSTGIRPKGRRDPEAEEPTLRILAVANPTDDLAATEVELDVVRGLAGTVDGSTIEVESLHGKDATRRGLALAVLDRDFDIVHFAGHANFDASDPHNSGLTLADGRLTADGVRRLKWSAPPYLVFNSACESARAAAGRRLVSSGGHANGLAAAFLAAGSEAYLGHFWPVHDQTAGAFASTFYTELFATQNVGRAVMAARAAVRPDFDAYGDLCAFGAVFVGDPGSAQRGGDDGGAIVPRRDLATAN